MEKKQESKAAINNDVRVSNQTAKYVMLVKDIDDVWNKIYDCLEVNFPERGERYLQEDFEQSLLTLKSTVMKYMQSSISENLGTNDNHSVI